MPGDLPPHENEISLEEIQRRAERFREEFPSPQDLAEETGGWQPFVRRMVRWAVVGFRRTRANDLAAGVAYYALLAIVPMALGIAAILGLIVRTDEGYRQAVELMVWIVPTGLTAEGLDVLPSLRARSGIFGLASIVGFLWIGSTFFAALARAMNRVYAVPDRPPLQQRVRGFVNVLVFAVLFTIAVIASTVPTVFLGISADELPLGLESWWIFTGLYRIVTYVVATLVAILLFAVIFRIAPAAQQRIEDVVPGAVVTGVAFVVVAQVFPLYFRLVVDWNVIGGTAGLLSLALIWFYVLAHLMLFGTYINVTWQRHRRGEG